MTNVLFILNSLNSSAPKPRAYKLTKAAAMATTPTTAAFKYVASEPAPFVWMDDGEAIELVVGIGVTRSVELFVVVPLPVPVDTGAVTIPEGTETNVVFETAKADDTLGKDLAIRRRK